MTTANFSITTSGMTTGVMHGVTITESPKDLIRTRVQQTMEGWVGQILVVGDVVWESGPDEDPNEAVRLANDRLIDRISGLFA